MEEDMTKRKPQVGDIVKIKSLATLKKMKDAKRKQPTDDCIVNKHPFFVEEMIPYCGKELKVKGFYRDDPDSPDIILTGINKKGNPFWWAAWMFTVVKPAKKTNKK